MRPQSDYDGTQLSAMEAPYGRCGDGQFRQLVPARVSVGCGTQLRPDEADGGYCDAFPECVMD